MTRNTPEPSFTQPCMTPLESGIAAYVMPAPTANAIAAAAAIRRFVIFMPPSLFERTMHIGGSQAPLTIF